MSQQIEYLYKPQGDVLEEYILSQTQRTMIMGPLGSGKTNGSCWKAFRIICNQEPDAQGIRRSRGIAIRNTYPDLFSTTIKDWLDMFEHLGQFKQGGKEPPTHYLKFKLEDGTTVEAEMVFLALDREDHVKKLRGLQATFAWVNEVKEIAFSIVSMLDLRVGRYPKDVRPTWYGIFGDTNAPDTDHWYYRLAEEVKPQGWTFLKQPGGLIRKSPNHPWEPNPDAENVQNLPRDYYANGAQGKTEAWILVNLANEYGFVGDGMPIYPDYVDSVHCREFELIPGLPLHIGLDFGLTPAAQIGQRKANGQIRIRYEVVTTDTGVARFAGILKTFIAEKCPGFTIGSITGDPAGDQRQAGDNEERTVFQLLAANGVVSTPAHTNDFTVRTEAISTPLRRMIDGEPGYLIHPDCRVTRKGMQGAYKFRRLKVAGDERYEDKPVKNAFSHPCFVAGTPISVGADVVPIERLRVGDLVNTPIGPCRVVANMKRPVDALVDVQMSNGITLRCTPDHPFAMPNGSFSHADALQYMTQLVEEGESWAGLQNIQFKSSTVCATTASQRATTRHNTQTVVSTFTGPFGQKLTDRFQKAVTSITRMATGLTAALKTWNVYPAKTTGLFTGSSVQKMNFGHCLTQLDHLLHLPTKPWQGRQPLLTEADAEWQRESCVHTSACNAASTMKARPDRHDAAFVVRVVKRVPGFFQGLMTWCATVSAAAWSSLRTSIRRSDSAIRVVQVKPAGPGEVFNLEVEVAHCYYAGGVLVSNCEAGQYLALGLGEGIAALAPNTAARADDAAAYRESRGLPKNADAAAFRRKRGQR